MGKTAFSRDSPSLWISDGLSGALKEAQPPVSLGHAQVCRTVRFSGRPWQNPAEKPDGCQRTFPGWDSTTLRFQPKVGCL